MGNDILKRDASDGKGLVSTSTRRVSAVRANPTNKITFTGYQVEGTPGRELLDRGRAEIDGRVMPVGAQVEAYDFSAHADRDGLFEFLDAYRDAEILVNHGDRCEAFAEELRAEGFDATAPELGETVTVTAEN